eukprot:1196038-Prorocentrum_minimum.AAC.6
MPRKCCSRTVRGQGEGYACVTPGCGGSTCRGSVAIGRRRRARLPPCEAATCLSPPRPLPRPPLPARPLRWAGLAAPARPPGPRRAPFACTERSRRTH